MPKTTSTIIAMFSDMFRLNDCSFPLLNFDNIFASAIFCAEWSWRGVWYFNKYYQKRHFNVEMYQRLKKVANEEEDFYFMSMARYNYMTFKQRQENSVVVESACCANPDEVTCKVCYEAFGPEDSEFKSCVCTETVCVSCLQNIVHMGRAECPFCRRLYSNEIKAKIVAMASKNQSEGNNERTKNRTKRKKQVVTTQFPEPSFIARVDAELKWKCGEKVNAIETERGWKMAVKAYLDSMKSYECLFNLAEEMKEVEVFAAELVVEIMQVSSAIVQWQSKTEQEVEDFNYSSWVKSYDNIPSATTCTESAKIEKSRLLALENESRCYRIDNVWTNIALKSRMTINAVNNLKRLNPALPSPLAYICNPVLAKRKIGQATTALLMRPRQRARKGPS